MFRRILFNNFWLVYQFSQRLRKYFTTPGLIILSAIIFAGIFGIDTRKTLSFQIFSLLLALLFFSILLGFYFRGKFSIKRILPEYATVNTLMNYQLVLYNNTDQKQVDLKITEILKNPVPTFNEFRQVTGSETKRNFFDEFVGYPRWLELIRKKRGAFIKEKLIEMIPAGQQIKVNMELKPVRRGYVDFDQTIISRPDPTNLFNSCKYVKNEDKLLILPKRYKIPSFSIPGHRKYQPGGINLAGSVGDSQEFISLRDYRPGDPLKNIHWRSLAKLKKPVVKEFQDEYFMRTGLVLDTFAKDVPTNIFEEAISIAASFASNHQQNDNVMDLMFIGDKSYHASSGRNVGHTLQMLEILASVQPCNNKSFSHLTGLVKENLPFMSSVICIFIHWDKQREKLIEEFRYSGIPCLPVLVQDIHNNRDYNEKGQLTGNIDLLTVNTDSIETDIKNITTYFH